jgi:hypothetical protein
MTTGGKKRYGFVALTILILEDIIVGGGLVVMSELGMGRHTPALVEKFVFNPLLALGFGALVLSIIGLFKDSNRIYAGAALVLGLFNFLAGNLLFPA